MTFILFVMNLSSLRIASNSFLMLRFTCPWWQPMPPPKYLLWVSCPKHDVTLCEEPMLSASMLTDLKLEPRKNSEFCSGMWLSRSLTFEMRLSDGGVLASSSLSLAFLSSTFLLRSRPGLDMRRLHASHSQITRFTWVS